MDRALRFQCLDHADQGPHRHAPDRHPHAGRHQGLGHRSYRNGAARAADRSGFVQVICCICSRPLLARSMSPVMSAMRRSWSISRRKPASWRRFAFKAATSACARIRRHKHRALRRANDRSEARRRGPRSCHAERHLARSRCRSEKRACQRGDLIASMLETTKLSMVTVTALLNRSISIDVSNIAIERSCGPPLSIMCEVQPSLSIFRNFVSQAVHGCPRNFSTRKLVIFLGHIRAPLAQTHSNLRLAAGGSAWRMRRRNAQRKYPLRSAGGPASRSYGRHARPSRNDV